MTHDPQLFRARMVAAGLSQREAAEHLGIHESLLSRYRAGIRPMPAALAEKLSAHLDRLDLIREAEAAARNRVLREMEAL